jgi:hypothetical protein
MKTTHLRDIDYWSHQQQKTRELQHPGYLIIGLHFIDQIRQGYCAVTCQPYLELGMGFDKLTIRFPALAYPLEQDKSWNNETNTNKAAIPGNTAS